MPRKKQKVWFYLDGDKNPKRADTLEKVLKGIQQKHDPMARRLKASGKPGDLQVVTTFRMQAMSDTNESQWETIVTYPNGPTHKRQFNGSVEVALAEHEAMLMMATK